MTTALITGTSERIHAVAAALEQEGFDALAVEAAGATGAGGHPLSPGSVDCYVQLAPATGGWGGPEPVGSAPLVRRIDDVATVSELLAADAAVVLVTDERGWDPARVRALEVLAGAAVAERAGTGVRLTVVDGGGPLGALAATARRERAQARAASLADMAPDLGYADWRDEVLSLTSGIEPTYFGWRGPDGVHRLAVLRRAVLSPLTGADGGALRLARSVLADAMGASGAAGADDLAAWVDGLAAGFAADVLGHLPGESFELPLRDVAAWVVRRGLNQDLGGQNAP